MNFLFVKVLKRLGLLKNLNIATTTRVNNRQITVPVLAGLGLENLYLELWMCHLLENIKKIKQGSYVDIGANVGQTLLKMRSVDQDVSYVGFEPNPQCIFYMRALVKANQFKNTHVIPVGLFDQNALLQLNLYTDVETDQSASVINDFRHEMDIRSKMYIPVFRFEDIQAGLGIENVSVIKIDVEGAELEVMQSLGHTIIAHQPFIFIEVLPAYSLENKERVRRQKEIEQLLSKWDYRIFRIHKNRMQVEKLELLNEIGIHGNMDWTDYVLAPGSLSVSLANYFQR